MVVLYNQLFDMVRKERSHQELQELPSNFYSEAKYFFDQLEQQVRESHGEQERLQLVNGKKLLRQLYEYREQKVMQLAQARCRTGSALVDTAKLLPSERVLFDTLVAVLCEGRAQMNIEEQVKVEKPKAQAPVEERIHVRVLKPVAQFIGKSMETYGPFAENENVELPDAVAQVLIRKGVATQLE